MRQREKEREGERTRDREMGKEREREKDRRTETDRKTERDTEIGRERTVRFPQAKIHKLLSDERLMKEQGKKNDQAKSPPSSCSLVLLTGYSGIRAE